MSDATCKTCPWWFDTASGDEAIHPGQCRRNPPSAQYIAVSRPTARENVTRWEQKTFYPFANAVNWCGEHPDRQPQLECGVTTIVSGETFPTAADMRRIVDALEKMASRAARAKS